MLRHLHLLPPGQTTCSSLSDRQWTCRKNQVRDLFCLICPPVSTAFFPHMSILQHSLIFGHWISNSLDQPIPIQVMPFHCRLSSRAFWELETLQYVLPWLSSALKKGLRVGRKGRSSWLSVPPSLLFGLLWISTINWEKEILLSPVNQEIIPQHGVFWKGFSMLVLAIKAEIRSPP